MFGQQNRNSYFLGVELVRSQFERLLYRVLCLSVVGSVGSFLRAANQRYREKIVARILRGLLNDLLSGFRDTLRGR